MQQYIEECLRLRTMLEQQIIQNQSIIQNNQQPMQLQIENNSAQIQEVLFQQETVLQQERDQKASIEVVCLDLKTQLNKIKERLKLSEVKLRKLTAVE